MSQDRPTISIIIKTLNEERHVASAIESALAAVGETDGEVILADARSSDRTVEIARRYPILIVQLNRIEDRSCGAGAQLGFQYSRGHYLLLMDGDMCLQPGFIPAAIEALTQDPGLAGVGGVILEPGLVNEEYEQRRRRSDPDRRAAYVTRLNGSAIYRRTAIESIAYLTDRNLHGSEEFDLGARLLAAGWKLARIDRPIVYHEPHKGSAYRLLLRRVFNKNAWAVGELIRGAIGRRHFWLVAKDRQCLVCLFVTGWWIAFVFATLSLSGWSAVFTPGAILLLPLAAISLRWRSVRLGLYSVTAWNVFTFCSWLGLLRPRIPPFAWIESAFVQGDASRLAELQTAQAAGQTFGTPSRRRARDADDLNRSDDDCTPR